ncbi:hypothetical protein MRB53_040632 [Persea americana]|nr:hypothetical protein MRB53_040632 [Persea americana]
MQSFDSSIAILFDAGIMLINNRLRTNYLTNIDGCCRDFSATEAAAGYVKTYPGDVVSAIKMEEICKSGSGQSKKDVDSTERVPDSSEKPRAAIRHASSSEVAMPPPPLSVKTPSQEPVVSAPVPSTLDQSEQGSRDVITHHIDDTEMWGCCHTKIYRRQTG